MKNGKWKIIGIVRNFKIIRKPADMHQCPTFRGDRFEKQKRQNSARKGESSGGLNINKLKIENYFKLCYNIYCIE